jgi:peptidoglycan/xylan/chitin deacetylase (PgdA/CDA1 family)
VKLIRWLGGSLSRGGAAGRLSILIFHRVLERPDPLFPEEPDTERFDVILRWVGAAFNVLPLDRAVSALANDKLPPRALAITFDDGYADNCSIAMPLLRAHAMCATFFIATEFLDGGRMWNDTVVEAVRRAADGVLDLSRLGLGQHVLHSAAERRSAIDQILPRVKYLPCSERSRTVSRIAELANVAPAELPQDLMMTSGQVRSLVANGMSVGGHTHSHPILALMSDEEALAEIAGGKARLEATVGVPVSLFAYPNGKPGIDYLPHQVELVKRAGYCAAVSTSPGAARRGADVFQLPRFTPWDRTQALFGLRMVKNLRQAVQVAV